MPITARCRVSGFCRSARSTESWDEVDVSVASLKMVAPEENARFCLRSSFASEGVVWKLWSETISPTRLFFASSIVLFRAVKERSSTSMSVANGMK